MKISVAMLQTFGTDNHNPEGILYGTTQFGGDLSNKGCNGYFPGCGVVFQLAPQNDGSWQRTVLHTFELSDGFQPAASLLLSHNSLWGTTINGGGSSNCDTGCGAVFEIAP